MKNALNTHYKSHRDVSLLLPWYVNNTLDAREKSIVESHLNICLTCRIALADMQKLSASVSHADPLGVSANTSFSRLRMRIHDDADFSILNVIKSVWLSNRGRWLTAKPAKNSTILRPLVVYSILVIIVSLGVLQYSYMANHVGEEYRTLSITIPAISAKNEIRVVFAKGISNNNIERILNSVQGTIIAGPSAQGVYRIRIGAESSLKPVDVVAALELLRDHTEVIFAEPALNVVVSEKAG